MNNRILYSVERIHVLLARAREVDFSEEQLRELAELRAEVNELREILALVVGTMRTQAEADVSALRGELERALARLCRRNPDQPLH
jgi:hypothetical protein